MSEQREKLARDIRAALGPLNNNAEPVVTLVRDLRQRVMALEAREAAMCDLSYANGAKQGYSWGQLDDNDALAKCVESRIPEAVSELKRLRQPGGIRR